MISSDPRLLSLAQSLTKTEVFNQSLAFAKKQNSLTITQLEKFNRDDELFTSIAQLPITMNFDSGMKGSNALSVEELIFKLSFHLRLKKNNMNDEIYECLKNIFKNLKIEQFKSLKLSILKHLFPNELLSIYNILSANNRDKLPRGLVLKLNLLKIEMQNFSIGELTCSPVEMNTPQENPSETTDPQEINDYELILQNLYATLVNERACSTIDYLTKYKEQISIALKNAKLISSEAELNDIEYFQAIDQLCLYTITSPCSSHDRNLIDCKYMLLNVIISALDDIQKNILGMRLITYIKSKKLIKHYYEYVFNPKTFISEYRNKFLSIVSEFLPDLNLTQEDSSSTEVEDVNNQPHMSLHLLYNKLLNSCRRNGTIYETFDFFTLNKDSIINELNQIDLLAPLPLLEQEIQLLSSLEQLILCLIITPYKYSVSKKTINHPHRRNKSLEIFEYIINNISHENKNILLDKLLTYLDNRKFMNDFYFKYFKKKSIQEKRISEIRQYLLNLYNTKILKVLNSNLITHTEEHLHLLDTFQQDSVSIVETLQRLRSQFLLMSFSEVEISIEKILLHLTLSLVEKDVANLEDKAPQSENQIIRFNLLIQALMKEIVTLLDDTELLLLQLSLQGKGYEVIENYLQTIAVPNISREVLEDQMLYLDTLISERMNSLETASAPQIQMQAHSTFTSTAQVYSALAVHDSSIGDAIEEALQVNTVPMQLLVPMQTTPSSMRTQIVQPYLSQHFQPVLSERHSSQDDPYELIPNTQRYAY